MISIPLVYGLFIVGVAAFANFRKPTGGLQAQHYAAAVYFGALALLPAEAYHDIDPVPITPPWIIGVLIPTPFFWFNKAWIAALAALFVAVRFAPERLKEFRPRMIDLPVALFCLWPLFQALFLVDDPNPPTWEIMALLVGNWAAPWFMGRIYFSRRGERVILIDALILFSLALMPISLLETASPVRIHQLLYGTHPFDADGVERYFGYRPMAFFEHGNQYGIWMAAAALAGWWRARFGAADTQRPGRWILALLLLGLAFASQSVGALVLLVLALLWLEAAAWLEWHRWIYRVGLVTGATSLGLLVIGVLTPASIGVTPQRIEQAVRFFASINRQSLQWRFARALDNLPQIQAFLVSGRGRWDWYTTFRPWDLTLMIIGYFGLIGLGLVVLMVAAGIYRPHGIAVSPRTSSRYVAMALIGMTIGDALANTFVFLPSLVLLGSLPQRPHRRQPQT